MITGIGRLTPSQAEAVARVLEAILVDLAEQHGLEVARLQRRRSRQRRRKDVPAQENLDLDIF
ncbi:MAG: hypothetical protein H6698_01890 [Myxococcales bacterium]|nr:hypothetical protein [Myxococcales bacterium]MCB9533062.1 hypothetical protein [Myxococcales bacterium]